MLAILNNYSKNPQFQGKVYKMTPQEMLKFEQDCPWGNKTKLDTFARDHLEAAQSYILTRVLNGDKKAGKRFFTAVKKKLDSMTPEELEDFEKGIRQAGNKFDTTV